MKKISEIDNGRRNWLKTASLCAATMCTDPFGRLFAEEKSKIKTILLISGWQDVNIGDITHTTGLLHVLETHFPEAKIILWKSRMHGHDSAAVVMIKKHFPKVGIVSGSVHSVNHSINDESLLAAIEEADIFIHGSGPKVIRWDALSAWSKITSKPYGIFGTTIQGVFEKLKPVLEKASFIYTRETASIAVLKKHGLTGDRIMFVPDATFALTTRDEETATTFLKERNLEDRKFICVIPRLRYTPYPGRMEKNPNLHEINEKYKETDHAKLREAMIAWIEKTRLPVLVCPEMTYEVDIMDELLIDPLPADLKKYVQKRGYWMPDEAASVYARAHSVLSFECHSPIIATAMGTPAFYLRHKEDSIKGRMYYDLGMSDRVFEIDQTTGKQIADRLLEVEADYSAALDKVAKVNDRTKSIYTEATEKVRKIFSGNTSAST